MLIGLIISFAACAIILSYLLYRNNQSQKESAKPILFVKQAGREVPVYHKNRLMLILLVIFSILCLGTFLGIVALIIRIPSVATETIAPSTPSPQLTATSSPTPEISFPSREPSKLQYHRIIWLDDVTPSQQVPGNFSFGGWSDRSPFSIGDRTYSHGIGMCISGTDAEVMTAQEETPDNILRKSCKKVSIQFPLREFYSKLVFSIGVDSSKTSIAVAKENNVRGRVIIADVSNEDYAVLFDTGWEYYTYAAYEREIPLSNVDLLQIAVYTCDFGGKSVDDGLRFAIIDPVLYLKDGA